MPAAKSQAFVFSIILDFHQNVTMVSARGLKGTARRPMTNEEMEKAIEFIVGQDARSGAKIDALGEKLDALAESQTRNTEGIAALLAIAQIHEREIETVTHQISSVSRDLATLGETTKATDERLNALINVVERRLSNGRNGKQ
jgi:hypothetical protein